MDLKQYKVINKGYDDYKKGVKYEDCPVKNGPDTVLIGYWQAGWMKAKNEEESCDA